MIYPYSIHSAHNFYAFIVKDPRQDNSLSPFLDGAARLIDPMTSCMLFLLMNTNLQCQSYLNDVMQKYNII